MWEPQNAPATRLYASMLDAHTGRFGPPEHDQKRYLWGLAQEVAHREQLTLKYGVKEPGAAVPGRESIARGYAVGHIERTGSGELWMRWESRWMPDQTQTW